MLQPDDVKIDHYAALGVTKETDLTKIRGAYRKLALGLHPDKIKDESQRESAREEWHRVQKAYEILSDERDRTAYDTGRAKYLDKEAKLAELKRELREHRRTDSSYASPRGSGSAAPREMRDGHIVEERVPMETYFDEAMRFTDEPNPMSRKHEDFGRRSKTRPTDDRKKSRVPPTSHRAAAKDLRDSTKATQADRAKKLDRERRRDANAKYEEQFDAYAPRIVDSESESELSGPEIFLRTREPSSSRRPRESRSRPTKPAPRRRDTYYEEDDGYSDRYDDWQSKFHGAQEHIQRSKYEGDVRPRSSRSPPPRRRGYDSAEPETPSSRRPARSSRSTRDRSSSRNNSYEHLDSRGGEYFKPPKMQSSTTSPNVKSSIRPSLFSRATSVTASAFTRPSPKRESSARGDSVLDQMVHEQVPTSRPSKLRNNDSGYSSSSTPEMPQRGHSPKVTARYTIDPETITIEPSKSKYRTASPDRDRERDRDRDRPSRTMPKRASTFAEPSRIEIRSVKPSRTYTDVEYTRPVGRSDIKYAKEIRPSDASYSPSRHSQKIPSSYYDHRHPPPSRRQSTAA